MNALPNIFGILALLIWSVYALLVSVILDTIPVFEALSLMFAVSFFLILLKIAYYREWYKLKQPPLVWLLGIVGVCGSDIFYVSGAALAPIAHIDFIDYLWPFVVIIVSGFLPSGKFKWRYLISAMLGVTGVAIMLFKSDNSHFSPEHLLGYGCALAAALSWSLYTLAGKFYPEVPFEMTGMYCGVGSILCWLLHLSEHEVFVPLSFISPSANGVLIIILGASAGLAYALWTYGTKRGNLQLLSSLAYCTPILSMSLLVACNKQPLSAALIWACILVISGIVVTALPSKVSIKEELS